MDTTPPNSFDVHFPPNCPPESADDASGIVYRLVSNQPPTPEDFSTHAERRAAPNADPCDRCGLSVYRVQQDAINQYRLIVSRHGVNGTRIGKLVARLALESRHGRLMPTPNKHLRDSHHTWWPFSGTDRLSSFEEIVEDASHAVAN